MFAGNNRVYVREAMMGFKNINVENSEPISRNREPLPDAVPASFLQERFSKKCLVAFILSFVYVFMGPFSMIFTLSENPNYKALQGFIILATIVIFFAAIAFSISGIRDCNDSYRFVKGKGWGIAGLTITLSWLPIVIIVADIVSFTHSITPDFNGPHLMTGNFEIRLDKKEEWAKKALVETWYWDGDMDHRVIEVPDKYSEDVVITHVGEGGNSPRSMYFEIYLQDGVTEYKDDQYISDEFSEGTVVHYEDLVFTMIIGKEVKCVGIRGMLSRFITNNDDGSITIYQPRLTFECSPDNPYLYSKDGKLYDADTNSLCFTIDESTYPPEK